jgi:HD superfamily phosphohydrolase
VTKANKRKIFNDPVYGFITIPFDFILDVIDHPWFQRLRRIKQLGMTHMVYPGALHTRFHHALGAMHLVNEAIEVIRSKGHPISPEEAEGVTLAILLHDIGHGPFSHALEHSIVSNIKHEQLSLMFMQALNKQFNGKLTLAIKIFSNTYKKKFLHQLVSGQLDMDRLDYLKRDSFYTGVSEGVVGSDRIIKMLHVYKDQLVVEEKGIYSIEKFIVARRLMYWQVYLHKTVLAAELMLVNILKRAKYLAEKNIQLFCTEALHQFLYHTYTYTDFKNNYNLLNDFAQLDDYDIMCSVKAWTTHKDFVLSKLCTDFLNRKLFKVELSPKHFDKNELLKLKKQVAAKHNLSLTDSSYFVLTETIENNAYNPENDKINLVFKNGSIIDITQASDNFNISAISKPVKKYVLAMVRI